MIEVFFVGVELLFRSRKTDDKPINNIDKEEGSGIRFMFSVPELKENDPKSAVVFKENVRVVTVGDKSNVGAVQRGSCNTATLNEELKAVVGLA